MTSNVGGKVNTASCSALFASRPSLAPTHVPLTRAAAVYGDEATPWFLPQRACGQEGCTPQAACAAYHALGLRCHRAGADGGSGVLLSRGLMEVGRRRWGAEP